MSRVYSERLDINEKAVRDFYDHRAARLGELGNRTVLLGDHSPEIAEGIDRFETENVLPNLTKHRVGSVLDLGCGIGRWAQKLLPFAKAYCGVDLSPEMVRAAEHNCNAWSDQATFYCMSASEAVQKPLSFYGTAAPFDTVLISEVCMYINDEVLDVFLAQIMNLLAPKCQIYHADTVALKNRLTLNEHYSDALQENYSVIYRPAAEWQSRWDKTGLHQRDAGFFPGTDTAAETARWFTILER